MQSANFVRCLISTSLTGNIESVGIIFALTRLLKIPKTCRCTTVWNICVEKSP